MHAVSLARHPRPPALLNMLNSCACPETGSRAACRPRCAFPTCRSLGHNTLGWHAASAKAAALHACQPCFTLMGLCWCRLLANWPCAGMQMM